MEVGDGEATQMVNKHVKIRHWTQMPLSGSCLKG